MNLLRLLRPGSWGDSTPDMGIGRAGDFALTIADIPVIELDGPPMAYFEIPLDLFATANGELESADHPEATRLVQHVRYFTCFTSDLTGAQGILDRVRARLKELGGGYLWWRSRPVPYPNGQVRFRLGTTPELPATWWAHLGAEDVR